MTIDVEKLTKGFSTKKPVNVEHLDKEVRKIRKDLNKVSGRVELVARSSRKVEDAMEALMDWCGEMEERIKDVEDIILREKH